MNEKLDGHDHESILTRCEPPTSDDSPTLLLPVIRTDDKLLACRSPVSPSPSITSTTSTTTTNASQTPSIVCRQADEVSSSPSSPTNSYGRLPFSRPIKNPSELDKKVRVVSQLKTQNKTLQTFVEATMHPQIIILALKNKSFRDLSIRASVRVTCWALTLNEQSFFLIASGNFLLTWLTRNLLS